MVLFAYEGGILLFVLNFFFLQWTSYRIGRCYLIDSGETIGWCLVGPTWPMTGFAGLPRLRAVMKNEAVNIVHRIDTDVYRPNLDWRVKIV